MHINISGNKSFVSSYDFTVGKTVTTPQFQIVKLDSNGQITPCTAATDNILGTVMDLPRIGWNGDVRLWNAQGTTNVTCGGTINAGDLVTSNSTGLGVATTTTGNNVLGRALEGGTSGSVIEVLLMPGKKI